MAGMFAGRLARGGLLKLAIEDRRGPEAIAEAIPGRLTPLDANSTRMLLDGITDPRQAATLLPAGPALAAALASQAGDVIADIGRFDGGEFPVEVLRHAATVTMVVRPTPRQMARAKPR